MELSGEVRKQKKEEWEEELLAGGPGWGSMVGMQINNNNNNNNNNKSWPRAFSPPLIIYILGPKTHPLYILKYAL